MVGRNIYMSCIVIFVVILAVCISDAIYAKDNITSAPACVESAAPQPLPAPEAFTHYEGSSLVEVEDAPPTSVNCGIEEDQILLDAKGVIVKTQGMAFDEAIGPMICVSIENTNDEAIDLFSEYIVINGIMIPEIISSHVDANCTEDTFFSFMDDPFAAYGIETIADIQVVFELLDTETLEPYYTSETIHIHTSLSGEYKQNYDSSGTLVFEDENFKVVYQGISDTRGYDPVLHFYIENNDDKPVGISTSQFYLNNKHTDYSPVFWYNMLPRTKGYAEVKLIFTEMNQQADGELENIAFYLDIIEPSTYDRYLEIGPLVINMKAPADGSGSL